MDAGRLDALDLFGSFYRGEIGEATLLACLVAIPLVEQTPFPSRTWCDDWRPEFGPLFAVGEALQFGWISAALYNTAIDAMIAAGHQA